MRRLLASLTLALGAVLAAAAVAQDPLPIELRVAAKVTPNKAGTKKRPQGVKIDVTVHIDMPGDYDPPLLQTVDVWFPKQGLYNGAEYPRCSEATLARYGVSRCPKGSIMGSGSATAKADSVPTYPKITIVNGGAKRVYFYTTMTNPARVQAPVVGKVTKLRHPRWGYKVHATIPRKLQIVAGVPILLEKLRLKGGRGDWIATTGCPRDKRWRYHGEATFETGQVLEHDGSVRCR